MRLVFTKQGSALNANYNGNVIGTFSLQGAKALELIKWREEMRKLARSL